MSVEVEVRDYLRSRTDVMSLLVNDPERCNIEYKGNSKAAHITIYRAGGAFSDYLPHENPIVIVHCFGTTRSAAAHLAQTVALALRAITQANDPLRSCSVESINYVPSSDGTARYVVTTVVTSLMVQTT